MCPYFRMEQTTRAGAGSKQLLTYEMFIAARGRTTSRGLGFKILSSLPTIHALPLGHPAVGRALGSRFLRKAIWPL